MRGNKKKSTKPKDDAEKMGVGKLVMLKKERISIKAFEASSKRITEQSTHEKIKDQFSPPLPKQNHAARLNLGGHVALAEMRLDRWDEADPTTDELNVPTKQIATASAASIVSPHKQHWHVSVCEECGNQRIK